MIIATFDEHSITLEGHAGFSKDGQDIVCSAISALTCNLINSLEEIAGIEVKSEIRSGYTKIVWKETNHAVYILRKSFRLGLEAINQEYKCINMN